MSWFPFDETPIHGQLYSVTFELMDEDGKCDFSTFSITIHPQAERFRALAHEMQEAGLAESGLHELLPKRWREAFCVCAEQTFAPLIRNLVEENNALRAKIAQGSRYKTNG